MDAQDLSNIIAGLSLIVSLITLILAFQIYDKFGLKGTFKAKEQQLVSDFIGELYGFKLGVLFENGSMSSSFGPDTIELFNRNFVMKDCSNYQAYLSKNLYDKFMILNNMISHPYFPSTIRDKCFVFYQNYRNIRRDQSDPNSLMFFCGDSHFELDPVLYFQGTFEGPFNVKAFINQLTNVLKAVEGYYKTNLPKHTPEKIIYRKWNDTQS